MADDTYAVRFDHPAPALHDVTDRAAGRVSIFDPERVGADDAGHWIEMDAEHVVGAEDAV